MFDGCITFFARLHPHRIAFATRAGEVTYAAFDADIDRVAGRLRDAFPCEPETLAHVSISSPYASWLALLALARLGVASAEVGPMRRPAILITDRPRGDANTVVHAAQDWFTATLAAPRLRIAPRRHPNPDGLARLIYSSGTTGTPKPIAVSWRMLNRSEVRADLGRVRRTLTMLGPDTIFGLFTGVSTWAEGGTYFHGPDLTAMAELLPKARPTNMNLATGQLGALLDRLPEDSRPSPLMQVLVGGSPLSKRLAERAMARLAGKVAVAYGSSEVLGIAMGYHTVLDIAPDAVGYVMPGAEVEIVDEAGRALPPGAQGEIRVRSMSMVERYLDDPEATAKVFRDGWFHPGDIGRLLPNGLLCVSGRVNEVMNIGGVKMLPHVLEDAALGCTGVVDAAVFAAPDPGAIACAHVAVVRGEGFDEGALRQALNGAAPAIIIMVVWAEAIPRNAMAKVDRKALASAFAASRH